MNMFQCFICVLIITVASIANAGIIGTYVDADLANTDNAVGGDDSTWGTTDDDNSDGLWEIDQSSSHESWDVFGNRDAKVVYQGKENGPEIVTTIDGLTPSSSYDIRLIFGSHSLDNHSIMGGLASDSLTVFDQTNSDLAEAGALYYENGYMNLRQALLGTATADAQGKIQVYIMGNAAGTKDGRALYDGVSYQASAVPEPGTLALVLCGMIGLVAMQLRGRNR